MQVHRFDRAHADFLGFTADHAGLVDDTMRGHAEFDRAQAQPFIDRDEYADHDRDQHDAEDQSTFGGPMQGEPRDDGLARRQGFVEVAHAASGQWGVQDAEISQRYPLLKFATQPSLLVNRRIAMK